MLDIYTVNTVYTVKTVNSRCTGYILNTWNTYYPWYMECTLNTWYSGNTMDLCSTKNIVSSWFTVYPWYREYIVNTLYTVNDIYSLYRGYFIIITFDTEDIL